METIGAGRSPCDLHRAIGSVSSGDPSLRDSTLLCAPSSMCYWEEPHFASEVQTSSSAARGGSCAPCACTWLSATVTCMLDVFIQVHPSFSPSGVVSLLSGCHGVTVGKSTPHFARIACDNRRHLCEVFDGLITLPLSPADIVSTDVSTHSTMLRLASLPSAPPGQKVRESVAGEGNNRTTGGGACGGFVNAACDPTSHFAGSLPTVALLVRFPKRCRHALILLRPSLGSRHRKCTLTYHASVRLVSESMLHVALTPHGDGVAVLTDVFIHDGSLPERSATQGDDASAALVLHGGYLPLPGGEQRSNPLQPLLLHIGLCGASAGQRILRSLLRCRLIGVWYRLRFPVPGAERGLHRLPAVAELLLYTNEGHALAFEPLIADAGEDVPASTGKEDQYMTTTYTCSAGAHIHTSRLHAFPSPTSTTASPPCGDIRGGALLVAPPWHFTDQWRHSLWFAKALALVAAPTVAFSTGDALGEGRRRRRRHRVLSVLAMSSNRRVWLLYTDSRLFVVTVPTGASAVTLDAGAATTLATAVHLDSLDVIHDAQYVAYRGQVGFLLLCRHSGMGTPENCGLTAEMSPVGTTSAMCDRFVHSTSLHSPVRLMFLSLAVIGAAASATAAVEASGAFMSPLLPVPLVPSSALASLSPSFAHPSSRLRFVCTALVAGTLSSDFTTEGPSEALYVSINSSGDVRSAWTATVRLPSIWSSCTSLLQLSPQGGSGITGGAGFITSGAHQAALTLQWTAHTLSALFPHEALLAGDVLSTARMSTALNPAPGSPPQEFPSAISKGAHDQLLETTLEAALLELDYPYAYGAYVSGSSARGVSLSGGIHPGGAVSLYPLVTVAFHDALDAFLHACVSGGVANTAGVAAVFAGFSASLRMSGLLSKWESSPAARGGGVMCTMRVVAFLHGCAQLLRHAVEDVSAVGDVSALLACASHLTGTVSPGKAKKSSPPMTLMVWEVWGMLLQPLFDFVWGVVHSYGVSAEVASDLLDYCSPAVQAMARSKGFWWSKCDGALHDSHTRNAAPPASPTAGLHHGGMAIPGATVGAEAKRDSTALLPVAAIPGSTAVAGSPATAGTAATTYTSAELDAMVRRVFLTQGASSALRLVEALNRHEATKAAVSDTVQVLETMRRRLERVAV